MAVVTFIVKNEQSKAREGKNDHQINSHNDGDVLDVYPYFINDLSRKKLVQETVPPPLPII
jgi:hypothetical protein